MLGLFGMRGVDRDDVGDAQHVVEIGVPDRTQLRLEHLRQPVAVVVMDREAEGARARGDRLADPAHADDRELLAADPPPEHPAGAPALPAARSDQFLAIDERSEEHTSELQSLMRISYAV